MLIYPSIYLSANPCESRDSGAPGGSSRSGLICWRRLCATRSTDGPSTASWPSSCRCTWWSGRSGWCALARSPPTTSTPLPPPPPTPRPQPPPTPNQTRPSAPLKHRPPTKPPRQRRGRGRGAWWSGGGTRTATGAPFRSMSEELATTSGQRIMYHYMEEGGRQGSILCLEYVAFREDQVSCGRVARGRDAVPTAFAYSS